jgi:Domain of unknown function (DUF4105)
VSYRAALAAFALLALPAPVPAQEPGSELEIYVMTMGVGAEIWERFGHNAIGVRNRNTGADLVYNYGTFDFAAPGFVTNFLKGRMLYWVDVADAAATVRFYQTRRQRSVWIQELNLTPAQRLELATFLEWNAREENKYYRYDYYLDNCSTRVRDALDKVIGGRIKALTDTIYTGATYRSHTRRVTTNNPLMYTGITAGTGQRVDRPISGWEEMFLPLAVREYLRGVTLPGPDGSSRPLVSSERTLYDSDAFSYRDEPPLWLPWYFLLGLILGAMSLGLARRGTRSRGARIGFNLFGVAWYGLMGLGGLILLGLWALTDHWVARQNENVLQLSLLALPLVVLLPAAVRKGAGAGRAALRISMLLTLLAAAGLVLKLLPWFSQRNLEIIALVLPVHLGLTGGLYILQTRRG